MHEALQKFIKPASEPLIRTCINFGPNCVGCSGYFGYCIDARRCYGACHVCVNKDCDNHPQNRDETFLCYADELHF